MLKYIIDKFSSKENINLYHKFKCACVSVKFYLIQSSHCRKQVFMLTFTSLWQLQGVKSQSQPVFMWCVNTENDEKRVKIKSVITHCDSFAPKSFNNLPANFSHCCLSPEEGKYRGLASLL